MRRSRHFLARSRPLSPGDVPARRRPVAARLRNQIAALASRPCVALLLAASLSVPGQVAQAGYEAQSSVNRTAPIIYALPAPPRGDWTRTLDRRRAEVIRRKIGNVRQACLMAGKEDYGTAQKATLSRVLAILAKSALARAILQRMAAQEVVICLDARTRNFAYYLSHRGLVAVNARLDDAQQVVFLAHEMAHVPQHPGFSDDRRFAPQDLILLRRIREAAAEALATRIAWQLKAAGHAAAWNAKIGTVYGDIADAFAASMRRPRPLADAGPRRPSGALLAELRATRVAFDQWFVKRQRLDVYDKMTLRHLSRIAGDRLGLIVASRQLTHAFLRRIADVGGESYLSRLPALDPHRDLTGPRYRAALSADNLRRLEAILDRGDLRAVGDIDRGDPPGPS